MSQAVPNDPKGIVDEFCENLCTRVRMDFDLYRSLFQEDDRSTELLLDTAPKCFGDVARVLGESLLLQFCKVTDPAGTGTKCNLTSNYIVEKLPWPPDVAARLKEANARLMEFRKLLEPARSKRLAHVDLSAQVERHPSLGAFPAGADVQFLLDLQTFVDRAYGHYHDGRGWPLAAAMSTDTHLLVRALEKAVVFDRCDRCDPHHRASAVLDYINLNDPASGS